jgi:hypothetical protein
MINDRLIDPDSPMVGPGTVSVGFRIPWYRAIPASCIAGVAVRVDGRELPSESLTFELNGRERRLTELPALGPRGADDRRVPGDPNGRNHPMSLPTDDASRLGRPVQGVTLYSFTRAFHARQHDLESLVRKTAYDGMALARRALRPRRRHLLTTAVGT